MLGFPSTNRFFTIFGRKDLRIAVSVTEFDAEADFDVYNYLVRPNSKQNYKKLANLQKNLTRGLISVNHLNQSWLNNTHSIEKKNIK